MDEDWSMLERLARAVHVKEASLPATLDAILAQAKETIDVADEAGLVLVEGRHLVPRGATGEPPEVLDALQNELGGGPCIDAATSQELVRIDDMSTEPRWPAFALRASALGVAGMLCLPLWIDERCLGTLSIFSSKTTAFSDRHVRLTTLFATHAALALADAQRTDQLHTALRNRDLIGQAKGILMERRRISADQAFGLLSLASQEMNVKLTGVAQHLVDTGELLSGER